MTKTARFTGKVDLYSTREGFAGPKTQPVEFLATFEDDGTWVVKRNDFETVMIDDIEGPNGMAVELTVTLAGDATGSSNRATGAGALDTEFAFELTVFFVSATSSLALELDNAGAHVMVPGTTVQGAAIDPATGRLVLAGVGAFSGGLLGGDRCAVVLNGAFAPNPWANG